MWPLIFFSKPYLSFQRKEIRQYLEGKQELVDVRDECRARRRVLPAELLQVPLAVVSGPWPQVGAGVEEERPGRRGPRHQGVAEPLHDLAEVVGTGHRVEPSAPGDLVPAPGFLEPQELLVGRDVHPHTPREQGQPDEAAGEREEGGGGGMGGVERPGAGLDVGVEEVEGEGAGGDEQGHGRGRAAQAEEPERVDERAVDVVDRVERGRERGERAGGGRGEQRRPAEGGGGEEEERGQPEGGALHEAPGDRGRDGRPPPRAGEPAVRRGDEAQQEDGDRAEEEQREQAPREERVSPGGGGHFRLARGVWESAGAAWVEEAQRESGRGRSDIQVLLPTEYGLQICSGLRFH